MTAEEIQNRLIDAEVGPYHLSHELVQKSTEMGLLCEEELHSAYSQPCLLHLEETAARLTEIEEEIEALESEQVREEEILEQAKMILQEAEKENLPLLSKLETAVEEKEDEIARCEGAITVLEEEKTNLEEAEPDFTDEKYFWPITNRLKDLIRSATGQWGETVTLGFDRGYLLASSEYNIYRDPYIKRAAEYCKS